jgi:hypothetical protein
MLRLSQFGTFSVPQRLKPDSFGSINGTAEAVPLQRLHLIRVSETALDQSLQSLVRFRETA